MKTLHMAAVVGCSLAVGILIPSASADVFSMPAGQKSLELVAVGDPGNAANVAYGTNRPYGAVPYPYQMGRFDVTAAQYARFLNAVAATDTYGLGRASVDYSYKVLRSGNPGSYTYTARPGAEDMPINYVDWGDAARFCNWLSNGQSTGPQGPGTTETGSYTLNGATTVAELMAVTRNPGASYVIPSEDEWYKAAYYKSGSTNAGYWMYPTRSDMAPSNVLSSTGTNNANYAYTDPVNLLTPVGAFAGSPGPYGTFDQGGNVKQWTEDAYATLNGPVRGLRGQGFLGDTFGGADFMRADWRGQSTPINDSYNSIGFRVALVPEPATLSLLALGGLLIARRRRA